MGIEKVSQTELFLLYCLLQRRPVNLAAVFILSVRWPLARGEHSRLALGPYIAQLARSLRAFDDHPAADLTVGPAATLFRFEDMQQMQICPLNEPRHFSEV
jgi:hypothetical protein